MKIVVCIRQSVSGEINPFDACAYEAALKIPNAEIILLSMGPEKTYDFLLGLTRLGAKKAVLLSDKAFAGADTLATSYTLSLAIKKLNPDLVICGRQTFDGDTAQVGPELSVLLGFNLITNVMALETDETSVTAETRYGGTKYAEFPALITVERINTLRLPSIRSKVGEVEKWNAETLGADITRTGLAGSPTKVLKSFENKQDRRKCRFIQPNELKSVIAAAIQKERVPLSSAISDKKLKKVWVITESPLSMAKTVSDDITVIPMDSAQNLAERIKNEKPRAVLWGSDYLSKETSARVAALLKLGLCADCTSLETDGEDLFMYRPAFSGNIIAKIKSTTLPSMATVRTVSPDSAPITVGIGYGVKENIEKAEEFAKSLGADTVASRLMVDHDYYPYAQQVGLTGKSISPDVYIAIGISGAVHHIAGIRSSGTIIAINSDKNAQIFDYADYGIVADFEEIEI